MANFPNLISNDVAKLAMKTGNIEIIKIMIDTRQEDRKLLGELFETICTKEMG